MSPNVVLDIIGLVMMWVSAMAMVTLMALVPTAAMRLAWRHRKSRYELELEERDIVDGRVQELLNMMAVHDVDLRLYDEERARRQARMDRPMEEKLAELAEKQAREDEEELELLHARGLSEEEAYEMAGDMARAQMARGWKEQNRERNDAELQARANDLLGYEVRRPKPARRVPPGYAIFGTGMAINLGDGLWRKIQP